MSDSETPASSTDQQLSEIRDLTRELLVAARELRGQSTRDAAIHDALSDVRAAARAMLTSPTAVFQEGSPAGPAETRGGEPCDCDCIGPSCCAFDIVLAKVRATKPQIEPPDAGEIPLLINALEVQIYVTAKGEFETGFLWPGIGSTMDLRADGAPGGPGPFVIIERVINRVFVKKGFPRTVEVRAEVREHDEGVERPIAFKDEIGEATGLITLDCCMRTVYPPMPLDVHLLHGGEGRGMIQLVYYGRRVCC